MDRTHHCVDCANAAHTTVLLDWSISLATASWGSYNNYVDQILPNFDPLPPRVDNRGHFTWYLHFVTWPSVDFLLTPSPPLLVHVVIEWPLVACGEHSKLFCILFTSVFANMWLKALTYFSTAHAQNSWPWNDLF